MSDLSHWDYADEFLAHEIAALVLGIDPPNAATNSSPSTGPLTPIIRRIRSCYESAYAHVNLAIENTDGQNRLAESFRPPPSDLQSIRTNNVIVLRSAFAISLLSMDRTEFEHVLFNRSEVARWIAANGIRSAYNFENPQLEKSKERTAVSIFSRMGDDREELHQWLIMDTWPKEAAMFLIAGVIPTQLYEGFGFFKITGGLLHNDDGEKDYCVERIAVLTRLWDSNPNHPDRAEPRFFFAWAAAKDIEIPWLDDARKAGYFKEPAPVQPPLQVDSANQKVLNTLLCIIAALCKEAKLDYGKPAKTAGLIQSTAAQMGVSLGETTIEGYLKKIPGAIAAREK